MIQNDSNKFEVNLKAYSGPLDVLLDLAKSQKVNLENISVTKLADQFHDFIIKAKDLIEYINCAPSILNIYDLDKIYDYYKQKFGVWTKFTSIVRGPKMLSIRNVNENDKKMLIKKYENIDWATYLKSELLLPMVDTNNVAMKKYCDDLSKHRNFNWRELWNEF